MGGDAQAKLEWLKFLGVRGFPTLYPEFGKGGLLQDDRSWPDADARKYSPPPKRGSIDHQINPDENRKLNEMGEAELRKQDLAQCDPRDLFTDDYMAGLTTLEIKGAKDENGGTNPELTGVMRKLAKGIPPEERAEVMEKLAAIRGVDAATLNDQYDRYLILRKQQKAVRDEKKRKAQKSDGEDPGVVPDLDESEHPEFLGSKPQLVFGAVVGEAYGIDPVFGALLSPTGGIIGPGNDELSRPTDSEGKVDPEDPLVYHGIVHDAAGYMFNYHDQGPGYDYLGKEQAKGHATSNPYTGQQSGIRYWHEKMDPSLKTTVLLEGVDVAVDALFVYEDAKALGKSAVKTAEEMRVKAEKAIESARETVTDAIDVAMKTAADTARKTATALERAAQEAASAAKATAARIEEDARALGKSALNTAEVMKAKGEEVIESAREAVNNALDNAVRTASDTAKKAGTALEQAAQEAASSAKAAVARVEETATEAMDSAKEAVGSVREGAAETLNAAWDFVWS